MTSFAVTIYRHRSREALDSVLGRRSTNEEHNDFLYFLNCNAHDWVNEQAKQFVNPVDPQ